uniref:Peptidase S1 domain-containing protein n=1 Tax=Anopheles melas TaxID=34690 RepID=A0A182TQH2_9DIPT
MLTTVRMNAKLRWVARCSPPFSLLLRTCACLLLLLGPLAYSPVEGQYLRSPCPDVFSYRLDPGTNQVFGYVELQGLRIGQLVKLNVDLSIAIAVPQNNVGSITLVKSREETFRDIYSNQPAQYRVNFPFNNVIPSVLAISVNGQTICTGQKATGNIVTTINLEHTLFTQMQPLANSGNNINAIQFQPQQNTAVQAPVYRPVQQQQPVVQPQPRPRPVQTPRPQPVQTQRPSVDLSSTEAGGSPSMDSSRGRHRSSTPESQRSSKYICGSTIIGERHLVTAAHCMYDSIGNPRSANDLTTVPGMHNIDNFFDADLQERSVKKIFIHEDYYFEDSVLLDTDIAVMLIDQPLTYNNLVRPICLWQESDNLEQIVGQKGFVSGWGVTEDGNAKYPSYVTATVVDRRTCTRNLERLIAGNARIFCADGHGSVPCTGDSGSGLVIKRGSRYYIRGIVSVGQYDPNTLTCARDKYVLYTDIAPFRYWLSRVVKML